MTLHLPFQSRKSRTNWNRNGCCSVQEDDDGIISHSLFHIISLQVQVIKVLQQRWGERKKWKLIHQESRQLVHLFLSLSPLIYVNVSFFAHGAFQHHYPPSHTITLIANTQLIPGHCLHGAFVYFGSSSFVMYDWLWTEDSLALWQTLFTSYLCPPLIRWWVQRELGKKQGKEKKWC